MSLPRGIRNRNPGNLERAKGFEWYGEIRPKPGDPRYDARFAVFDEVEYGIRAMMKNLITYNQRRGIKTLREAINRWAPDFENDVSAYLKFVSKESDIAPDDEWDFTQRIFLIPVVRAMIVHENGWPTAAQRESGIPEYWYSPRTYENAYELAVKGRITSHTMNEVPVKKSPEAFKPRKLTLWERIEKWLDTLGVNKWKV